MRYYYRKYCLIKALRKDYLEKSYTQPVSYVVDVGGIPQEHDGIRFQENGVLWDMFIHWFIRNYTDNFPTFRKYFPTFILIFRKIGLLKEKQRDNQKDIKLIKEFNSILLDENGKLVDVALSSSGAPFSVKMKSGYNDYIYGIWWRTFLKFSDYWWGKGIILLILAYLAKLLGLKIHFGTE